MADVEEENEERVICEDEEDTNIDIDSEDDEEYEFGEDDEDDFDHYDSPLDKIDEVLNFSTQLNNLQAAGGQELYNYLM